MLVQDGENEAFLGKSTFSLLMYFDNYNFYREMLSKDKALQQR